MERRGGVGPAVLLRPDPMAPLRLFCVPHAGGGAGAYRTWPRRLTGTAELFVLGLPRREGRPTRPAPDSLEAAVEPLVASVERHAAGPFALFGHSMGAVVAYETALSLVRRGDRIPRIVVVSGRAPPWHGGDEDALHELPDPDFVRRLQERYGGIPPEVLEDPELLKATLPALRADLRLLEGHRRPHPAALPCPVLALGGRADPSVDRSSLEAWRDATRETFQVRRFDGGHFFVREREAEVVALIRRAISTPVA